MNNIISLLTFFGLLVALSGLSIKLGIGVLFMLGLCVGVAAGAYLGMSVAIGAFNNLVNSQNKVIEGFITRWVQPRVVYSNCDPMLLEAVCRLTRRAVLEDQCGICGSDNENLVAHPFDPKNHSNSCPVPFARHQYELAVGNRCKPTEDNKKYKPNNVIPLSIKGKALVKLLSPSSRN